MSLARLAGSVSAENARTASGDGSLPVRTVMVRRGPLAAARSSSGVGYGGKFCPGKGPGRRSSTRCQLVRPCWTDERKRVTRTPSARQEIFGAIFSGRRRGPGKRAVERLEERQRF